MLSWPATPLNVAIIADRKTVQQARLTAGGFGSIASGLLAGAPVNVRFAPKATRNSATQHQVALRAMCRHIFGANLVISRAARFKRATKILRRELVHVR